MYSCRSHTHINTEYSVCFYLKHPNTHLHEATLGPAQQCVQWCPAGAACSQQHQSALMAKLTSQQIPSLPCTATLSPRCSAVGKSSARRSIPELPETIHSAPTDGANALFQALTRCLPPHTQTEQTLPTSFSHTMLPDTFECKLICRVVTIRSQCFKHHTFPLQSLQSQFSVLCCTENWDCQVSLIDWWQCDSEWHCCVLTSGQWW